MVGLEVGVPPGVETAIDASRGEHRAARVAVQRLYLDDVGSEVAQHRRRDGPELPDRPVDNLDAGESSRLGVVGQLCSPSQCERVRGGLRRRLIEYNIGKRRPSAAASASRRVEVLSPVATGES